MIAYIVTAAISSSAGVLGMGMWCGARLQKERQEWDDKASAFSSLIDAADKISIDYATERRKRLEAEQAHTDLADKHNCTNTRIENVIDLIDSIPHRKGKETRIKAMLLGEV